MRLSKDFLEKKQTWLYGIVIVFAVLIGIQGSIVSDSLAPFISPCIMLLMFAMFTQIPFLAIKNAFRNKRFIYALVVGNFIVMPLIVTLLLEVFPQSPAVLAGICLVLLAPCIDYVIIFTYLGKGNERLMLAVTPILLLVQLVLLPIYLYYISGEQLASIVQIQPFSEAFLLFICCPLVIALLTQILATKKSVAAYTLQIASWLPVPLMAAVLFVVIASQMPKIIEQLHVIASAVPVYICYVILAPLVARVVVFLFKLQVQDGRTLIFSMSTRNSLVMLPLAFALPDNYATIAAAVIVMQTIVELIGELLYIQIVPKLLLKKH